MPPWLLLAMQASGMIVDFFGAKSQQGMMDMGMKVQQAGIEAEIEENKLQTADESLAAMKNLRQNLGSQIAANAARGTQSGAGSAFLGMNESVGAFNADEKVRQLNSLSKENQLRAGGLISSLNNGTSSSQLWQGFASRTFNKLSTNPLAYKAFGKKLVEGFDLTSIGS
jgi:hypothetical protein